MKIAIIVGHTPSSPGAVNARSGISEWDFNDPLAREIAHLINTTCNGHEAVLVYRDLPNDYNGLPSKVNRQQPDAIISLHANGHSTQAATGTEMLYWHSSQKGKELAGLLQQEVLSALGLRDRGLKPIHDEKERGGKLLFRTRAPCVICEPFFITTDDDLETAQAGRDALIDAYVTAIKRFTQG